MIKGKDVVLFLDNTKVAVATNATVELTQEAVEVTPFPGSGADNGWRHYSIGGHGWSISHDGLFTEDTTLLDDVGKEYDAAIDISDVIEMSGTVNLSEVSVQALVHSLVKLSAKFVCANFPSVIS